MFCLRFKICFVRFLKCVVFCLYFRWAGSCAEANFHKMDQLSSSKGEPSHVRFLNQHAFIHVCMLTTSLHTAVLICHKTGGTSPGQTWTYTLISSLDYCASFYQGTVSLLTVFTYRQLCNTTTCNILEYTYNRAAFCRIWKQKCEGYNIL